MLTEADTSIRSLRELQVALKLPTTIKLWRCVVQLKRLNQCAIIESPKATSGKRVER